MDMTFAKRRSSRDRFSRVSLEKFRIRLYFLFLFGDAILMGGALLVIGSLYHGGRLFDGPGLELASAISPIFVILSFYLGLYSIQSLASLRKMALTVLHAAVVSALLYLIVSFFTKTTAETSRVVLTLGLFFGTIAVLVFHSSVIAFSRARTGTTFLNVIIVEAGGPPVAVADAHYLDANNVCLHRIKESPEELHDLGLRLRNMDRVIVNCQSEDRADWAHVLKALGVRAEITSPILEKMGALDLQKEDGFTTILVATGPLSLRNRVIKRALDLALAIPATILLSPLLIGIAIAIIIDDGRPIFFRQRRTGRNNCFFTMLKYRSMRVAKADADGKVSASRDDDRVTKVGRFLRRTSLDELPQLLNVISGHMSIVGPRPHAIGSRAGNKLFWEVTTEYWQRHAIKPGLTGLAQVRGFRGATDREEDLTSRLRADLEYLVDWTPQRDLLLIMQTLRVLVHPNAY
tara:strand:+ start:637 stop:2022 length:1386 start_codon:yes stop_codon:yes gene_type:complete